jgi:hypothetical protein
MPTCMILKNLNLGKVLFFLGGFFFIFFLFGMLVNRLYTQTKTNSKQRYTMQQLKKRLCTRYGKRSIKPLKCR